MEREECYKCPARSTCSVEQGRITGPNGPRMIVRLPRQIGDTVYRVNMGAADPVIPLKVTGYHIHGYTNPYICMQCMDEYGGEYGYTGRVWGIKVYFSREEAEERAKRLKSRQRGK